nr:GMC family oxidoreductase [Rhabdothermincola salaria]
MRHADDIEEGAALTADVCIIGSGPAGLTVAAELVGSGLSVLVLESGGEQWDPRTQALAEGRVSGEGFRFNSTEVTPDLVRLRQFGGSSNHWTGMCRPFDPHDFEVRAAVDGSGWPFGAETLAPHYVRAAASCDLATDVFDAGWWRDQAAATLLADGHPVRTTVFQFSPPTRFGTKLRPLLDADESTQVVLWANVTSIDTDPGGTRVDRLQVATLSGRRFQVSAGRYVLAVGGIEAPRLLLASTASAPSGVGNSNDLVGRHFMEHPHHPSGRILFAQPREAWDFYTIGQSTLADGRTVSRWAGLGLSAQAQAEAGIANASVQLYPGLEGGDLRGDRDRETMAMRGIGRLLARGSSEPPLGVLSVRTEQVPDPDNRVTLGRRLDELGLPEPVIEWHLNPEDRTTLRATIRLVGEHLAATGAARVELDPSGSPVEDWPTEIGNHHMGTTRMHVDPNRGVVDENCRMHEVENLYVAGSAVFPTSGMANPTLTLVALAHRLADHLRT